MIPVHAIDAGEDAVDDAPPDVFTLATHELRSHLTPLLLQADLLRSGRLGDLSARQSRAVEQIGRSLDRTMVLLHEVLDTNRIRKGHLTVDRHPLDVEPIVHEAVAQFQGQAEHIGVLLDASADAPLLMEGDRHRIQQVLTNLIGNALKFTPHGGSVVVSARDRGAHVLLSIRDTGRGFAPGEIDRLFQPFVQVGSAMPDRPGTGLGLYIVRGIVHAHGGRVWAESEGAGKGSALHVELPRHPTGTSAA